MRRFGVFLSIIAVVLLGIVAVRVQPVAIAQEATPGAEEMMPEGITFEPLGLATGVTLPSVGELFAVRIGLEPGTAIPIEPGDPATVLGVIESGELTIHFEGPLTITRAEELGGAMGEAEAGGAFVPATETIPAGQEVTVGAGDSVLFPPNVGGEIRNDGQERAVALGFFVSPPAAEGTPAAGTPTP